MSAATTNLQCYVTMKISVCNYCNTESKAYLFLLSDTVNVVIEKAKKLAQELPWGPSSSKIYAWDDLTNIPLDGNQPLMSYYPNGSATIRVEIEDYLTRGVLSQ